MEKSLLGQSEMEMVGPGMREHNLHPADDFHLISANTFTPDMENKSTRRLLWYYWLQP
jgi:hypothetical protein